MSTAAERNARADARARAAGFSSRSQQYRAGKQNYRKDQGAEYGGALAARRGTTGAQVVNTRAGTVITVNLRDPGATRDLIRAIRKAAK